MKRLAVCLLLSLVPLSGCGGGNTDLKPVLVGTWRVRSFSVMVPDNQIKDPKNPAPNEIGTPLNCPSSFPAGNFFQNCTANSTFTFRDDSTAIAPDGSIHAYERHRLTMYYFTPARTETLLTFSGANDSVLVWHQDKTDLLPAVDIIMERVQ